MAHSGIIRAAANSGDEDGGVARARRAPAQEAERTHDHAWAPGLHESFVSGSNCMTLRSWTVDPVAEQAGDPGVRGVHDHAHRHPAGVVDAGVDRARSVHEPLE